MKVYVITFDTTYGPVAVAVLSSEEKVAQFIARQNEPSRFDYEEFEVDAS